MTEAPVSGAGYLQRLSALLDTVASTQAEAVVATGELVGRSVAAGGVVHLFGAGHSRLPAEDVCLRAGSLTSSRAIWPDRFSDKFERFPGLAPVVLRQDDVRAGEVLFVISNSGINPMPVEVAQLAREGGATVVGVGSRQHSLAAESRHPEGLRLLDVCDVFLDTCVPAGDALLSDERLPGPVGPASTVAGAALLHAVLVEAMGWMVAAGHVPPVRISRNLPAGDRHNAAISERYADRIPESPVGLTWRAGAAALVLPVGAGTPLAGYGSRTAPASGVLRPLEVDVLVLSAGDGTVVLVTLDLLAVDAEWVTSLRDRVSGKLGVRPDGVLVAASHTHAGPAGFRRVGATVGLDAPAHDLRRRVLDLAVDAVERAAAEMVGVEVRLGTGSSSVTAHRTDPELPADRRLTRVDVTTPDGRPVAVVWHFACHATVLGADNTLVSPDLPGEVRALLRDDVGHDVPVLYLNGAAGDLSTRFTRRDQTPAEVRRLAGLVVDALPDAGRSLPPAVPAGRTAACRLPAATEDADDVAARLDRARAALAEPPAGLPPTARRVLDTAVVGLEKRLARLTGAPVSTGVATAEDTEDLTAVVQVLDLGELLLVGIPGELFSADGERIRDGSAATALPIGYAGDYLGYLPPTGAGAGYETDSAVVAAGAGDVLVGTARDLVAGGRA